MTIYKPDGLISWFKSFDFEYIDEDLARELQNLDINDPGDQDVLIEKAVLREYAMLNDISRKSLKELLIASEKFREADILEVFDRVNTPFEGVPTDIRGFLRRILARLD